MRHTKRTFTAIFALTLGAMSTSGWAQPPMRGPDRFDGPPPARFEGRLRRDNSKRRLSGVLRSFARLERSVPLSRAQAQRTVSLLRPWQNRPQMTQTQAKTLHDSLNAVLTARQKSALNTMRENRRKRRGGEERGGPRDGMRGPRGEGGRPPRRKGFMPPRPSERGFDPQRMRAQRRKMRGFIETMNPFYPPTRYAEVKALPPQMQESMTRRYRATQAALSALSHRAAR